jgi:hypothetical protein
MKFRDLVIGYALASACFVITGAAQNQNGCVNGQRNGITYTDCWVDPGDDTSRLQAAINLQVGKVVFNEKNYSISGSLQIYSHRTIEGLTSNPGPSFDGSRITQITANTPIFTIGEGIYNVSIKDIGFASGVAGVVGIKAAGTNGSSQNFHFSNLHFQNLSKGIHVEANGAQYQFDNIRLEHSVFVHCDYAVHVNSWNSGWQISNINVDAKLGNVGFYFEKSTYTSINLVIGNGNTGGSGSGSKLFWIKEHGNLSIQNSVSEGFIEHIDIDAPAHEGVIYLMNNHYNGKVTVKNAMVVSSGNSFVWSGGTAVDAIAKGTTYIFSMGDKFCSFNNPCTDGWQFQDSARMIYEAGVFKNTTTVPTSINYDPIYGSPALSIIAPTNASGSLLRLGRGTIFYDVTRKEGASSEAGFLEFVGNQAGFGGYSFKTQGGTVNVNYNGSVTFGTSLYSSLGSPPDGTVVYCSNCQQSATCASGGSGALAKMIAGTWKCN